MKTAATCPVLNARSHYLLNDTETWINEVRDNYGDEIADACSRELDLILESLAKADTYTDKEPPKEILIDTEVILKRHLTPVVICISEGLLEEVTVCETEEIAIRKFTALCEKHGFSPTVNQVMVDGFADYRNVMIHLLWQKKETSVAQYISLGD